MSDIKTLPEFNSLINIFFKLYDKTPPDPVMFWTIGQKHYDEFKNLLSSLIGEAVSPTFAYTAYDLANLPIDQIILLDQTLQNADITGNGDQQGAVSENSEPFYVSHKTATPAYVKLLGKITPDLAAKDPRGVLPAVFDSLIEDKNLGLSREQLSTIFAPLASKIIENDQDADSLHRILTSISDDPKVSNQILIYHLANPTKDTVEFAAYVQSVLPKDKIELAPTITAEVLVHELARTADPDPHYESVKQYIIDAKNAPNQSDTYLKHFFDNNNLDTDSALKAVLAEKEQVLPELYAILNSKNPTATQLERARELYKQKRNFENIERKASLHKAEIVQLRLIEEKKVINTPLENELVAQYVKAGLIPSDARKLAKEFIGSGLATSTQYLGTYADSESSKKPLKQSLHSEALAFLAQQKPELAPFINKLKGFKLNVEKFDQAFKSVAYFRNLIDNPASMLQIFTSDTILKFVNSLGIKQATVRLKNELISKVLVKFAESEIGKTLLKKGVKLVTKEAIKKGLDAALVPILGPFAPIVGEIVGAVISWAIEKVKDLVSWTQRKFKENSKMFAAALAAIFVGFFTSAGVGGAAAAGAITYGIGSAAGGLSRVLTGNPSSSMVSGARTAGQMMTAIVTETASDSVAGIVLIILAIPILLALVLFIINTSAYVVPQEIKYFGGLPSCWPVKSPSICQDPCGTLCASLNGVSKCTHHPNYPNGGLNPGGLNAFDLCDYIQGEPIYATHNGTVVAMVSDGVRDPQWGGGYGNYVVIKSDDGQFATLYGHMPYLGFVNVGQHINTGIQIGVVGNTGVSFGPHLHYELRAQVSGFTTDVNLCTGEWGLGNLVPPVWSMGAPGTEYSGTCYANSQ